MKKTFVVIMLIVVLILSACGGEVEITNQESSAASAITAPPEENGELIKGKSLDKIGYRCKAPLDIEIEKDTFLDMWSSTGDNYSEQRVDGLVGEDTYTLISVYFYGPHSLGSEILSFMCLQAFPTADTNEKKFIKIGEEIYTFDDLQSYLVFKTDDICVYDIYKLIGGDDLKTQITKQVDIHNGLVKQCVNATAEEREKFSITMTENDYITYEDYNYLYDIATYYTTNMGDLIVKK